MYKRSFSLVRQGSTQYLLRLMRGGSVPEDEIQSELMEMVTSLNPAFRRGSLRKIEHVAEVHANGPVLVNIVVRSLDGDSHTELDGIVVPETYLEPVRRRLRDAGYDVEFHPG